jgi:transglutaminase-like putative cysteine protease
MIKVKSPAGFLILTQLIWPLYFSFLPLESMIFSWVVILVTFFRWSLPRWPFFALVPLAMVWSSYQYGTFFDPEAAAHFLFLLIFCKSLELKDNRDFFSFFLMSVLLLASSCLFMEGLDQFLLAIAHIFVLFLIWFSADKRNFWSARFYRSEWKPAIFAFVMALPMAFSLFIFFPRFQGGLMNLARAPKAKIGYTQDVRIDRISKLLPSDEVVFRVESDAPLLAEQAYWRGNVLFRTDGLNWYHIHRQNERKPFRKSSYPVFDYQVEVVKRVGDQVFQLEHTQDLQTPGVLHFYQQEQGVAWIGKKRLLNRYSGKQVMRAPPERKDPASQYLELPSFIAEDLATVIDQLDSDYQGFLKSLQNYFQSEGFLYSLEPGEQSSIEEFLLQNKKGFCTHFASATALLARAKGIPSRLVSGFLGAELNAVGDYYVVRDNDAHVWVELYDQSSKTWQRVDPTGFVDAERLQRGGSDYFLRRHGNSFFQQMLTELGVQQPYQFMRQWVDNLNRKWFQLMLGLDGQVQKKLASQLKLNLKIFYSLSFWGVMLVWVLLLLIGNWFGKRANKDSDQLLILKSKFLQKLKHKGHPVDASWGIYRGLEFLEHHYGKDSQEYHFYQKLSDLQYRKDRELEKGELEQLLKEI